MKRFSLFFIFIVLAGCSSIEYKDADKAAGSAEFGFYEINLTTSKMVDSIFNYLKNDWKKEALIQIKPLKITTDDYSLSDKGKMLENSITTSLNKKKIAVYDKSFEQDVIDEVEKGQAGFIDAKYRIPVGKLRSPNFYLFGEINTTSSIQGRTRKIMIDVTLILKEHTGVVRWQDQQKILKVVKNAGVSY